MLKIIRSANAGVEFSWVPSTDGKIGSLFVAIYSKFKSWFFCILGSKSKKDSRTATSIPHTPTNPKSFSKSLFLKLMT